MNILSKIIIVSLGMGLVACTLPVEEVEIAVNESQAVPEEQAALSTPTPAPAPVPIVVEPDLILRARILADILYAAKGSFDDNDLMFPAGDNAYDRYLEVLEIEPENAVALEGIQEIFHRYLELAESAMTLGQYDQAEEMLLRAESIEPNNILTNTAHERLVRARLVKIDFYALDPMALAEQNSEVLVHLWSIGQYIRSEGGTFLITARNDEEGRWIYKVMREAVGGFRLRGDITLGNPPGILVTIPKAEG